MIMVRAAVPAGQTGRNGQRPGPGLALGPGLAAGRREALVRTVGPRALR